MKKATIILCILLNFLSCDSKNSNSNSITILDNPLSDQEFLLGTTCFITVYAYEKGSDPEQAMAIAFSDIEEMEQRLSVNIDTSEIARFNEGSDNISFNIDSIKLIEKALSIAELSKGHFDPTIGQLVDVWGIGSDHSGQIPSDEDIKSALNTIDYKQLSIDGTRLTKFNPSTKLDLGGIAKGHAADIVKASLRENGITSAIINLGGNVQLLGRKSNGKLWKIGVQDPELLRGQYLGILEAEGKAVVTSGVYERFFMVDGVRYHHILDSETGYPVRNGLVSTTIVADDSTHADGYSTALFSLGLEEGMKLAESLDEIEAIFVDDKGIVNVSSGLKDIFTLSSSDYYQMAQ